MTTQVNSFQDILDALEQNPELRSQIRLHILTEELLQLPAQFLLLRKDVDELRNDVTELRSDVDELRKDVTVLRSDVDELRKDVTVLRSDVDELRNDVTELRNDVTELRNDVTELRNDVTELKAGQDELKTGQRELQTRMNRVEGRLGNIDGILYEQSAVRIAVQLASMELGIEGPRVAYSKFDTAHPNFNQALDAALRSGVISREQFRDLLRADVIVYGQSGRHAVVEISLGPNEDDIFRSIRRAEILQAATGDQVTPVVATPDPHAAFIQQAEESNAQVLDIPA